MKNNLACNQVIALLSFYIDKKTNYQVTNFIQAHLCKCKSCRYKYEVLAKIFNDMNLAKAQIDKIDRANVVLTSEYDAQFKEKMSAYLDSELSDNEIVKFKKFAIVNPPVRGELEGMYKVKNALNNSFEKTKKDFKDDFTKDIIVKLDLKDAINIQEPVLKIASIFIFLIVFASVWVIVTF